MPLLDTRIPVQFSSSCGQRSIGTGVMLLGFNLLLIVVFEPMWSFTPR